MLEIESTNASVSLLFEFHKKLLGSNATNYLSSHRDLQIVYLNFDPNATNYLSRQRSMQIINLNFHPSICKFKVWLFCS